MFLTASLLATTAALHSSGSALLRRGQTTCLPTRQLRCDRQRSVVFHGGSHSHAHHDHEHEVNPMSMLPKLDFNPNLSFDLCRFISRTCLHEYFLAPSFCLSYMALMSFFLELFLCLWGWGYGGLNRAAVASAQEPSRVLLPWVLPFGSCRCPCRCPAASRLLAAVGPSPWHRLESSIFKSRFEDL